MTEATTTTEKPERTETDRERETRLFKENESLIRWTLWNRNKQRYGHEGIDEDEYQEACLAFIKAARAWDPQRATLSTCAVYYIRRRLDTIRRLSMCDCRRIHAKPLISLDVPLSFDSDTELIELLQDDAAGPEETATARETVNRLLSRAQLDPKDREIILLLARGLSMADIARKLKISRERIRQRRNRAMKRIRQRNHTFLEMSRNSS